MDRYTLKPLPPGVRLLTTDESVALDRRAPWSISSPATCKTCKGARVFRWYNDDRTDVVEYDCPCNDQYVLSRWLAHSGVMNRWQRLGWGDFEQLPVEVIDQVQKYMQRLDRYVGAGIGLVVSGNRGTGKTLLAHLILKELIAKGLDCYATSFSSMIDMYVDGWRDKEQSLWFNRRIRDVSVLFIDDLGRERNQGANSVGENMLESVIRYRVACQQPTFITTNLRPDKMGSAYGGHTESLLSECSMYLTVDGQDARKSMEGRMEREIDQGLLRPVVCEVIGA